MHHLTGVIYAKIGWFWVVFFLIGAIRVFVLVSLVCPAP